MGKSVLLNRQQLTRLHYVTFTIGVICLLSQIPTTNAQDNSTTPELDPEPVCSIGADVFIGNAQSMFRMSTWIKRGICIRTRPHPPEVSKDHQCYVTLVAILGRLNELRKSEYGGAAGVLTLLPTIGALLGAPSNEIWRLMSIVPFGGGLAMALSFGGAIMPVKIEDYEHVTTRRNNNIVSIFSLRKSNDAAGRQSMEKLRNDLVQNVRTRIEQRESARLPKQSLALGLTGMILLLIGSQAAMAVVEQGGVIAWWCVSRWWMHLWYFMVTLTAMTENWVQLPFVETYKLYVSSLPYDVFTDKGESIIDYFKTGKAHENVAVALRQLSTLRPATVTIQGSKQYTRARNSVMIMVSVVGDTKLGSFWRLLSKSTSIAVFVSGTALFASVTLLSLPMAVMVLTLNLAAGVFGRAIAGWMINRVSESEPMIHVIADNPQEAYKAVTAILTMKSEDGTQFQIEVNGHIFINERRVARRSPIHVNFLGVIAEPYDIRKAEASNNRSSGILSHSNSWSISGAGHNDGNGGADAHMPFLPDETLVGSPMPTILSPGIEKEKRTSVIVQSVSNDTSSVNSADDNHIGIASGSGSSHGARSPADQSIPRKPVRVFTS